MPVFEETSKKEPAFGTWMSVEEYLPVGDEVIGWDGETVSTFFPVTGDPPHQGLERCKYLGMTHWMPLPDPPEPRQKPT